MDKKLSCRKDGPAYIYLKASVRLLVAERKRLTGVTAVTYTLWRRCYIERYKLTQDAIR